MKKRTPFAIPLIMSLLLLLLGCSDPIGPSESCSGQPANTSVKFEDADLKRRIREDLEAFGQIGPGDDLTCGLLSGKTALLAGSANIRSLAGIQNLTSLTVLGLDFNSITDISPLSGLTSLTDLYLANTSISDISPLSGLTSLETLFLGMNSITDISALSGLTSLRWLELWYNSITDISALSGLTKLGGRLTKLGGPLGALTLSGNPDLSNIQPLLDNTGLGAGDTVVLNNTNVSCADVAALEAKGVTVVSDCP